MKPIAIFTIFALITFACGQKENEPLHEEDVERQENADSSYDAELANRLGADEYGMKKYVLAILKSGPTRDQDSTTAAQIQRGHMDNITKLADEGKLVAAGPFFGDSDFQGLFVFNVETVEEAQLLTETDPAVQAGRLVFEFHQWYSSASLQLINEWHGKIAKVNP